MRKQSVVADTIRERVISAQRFGTLEPDGRLPSARALAIELDVDPRVVVAAYRGLERDGLVERRPPSRAFFAVGQAGGAGVASQRARGRGDDADPRPVEWLADVLAQALERDIPAPTFAERAWRATDTLRLRAVCIECNQDHITWLCRELQDDYGLDAVGLEVEELPRAPGPGPGAGSTADGMPVGLPLVLQRADLLVTTRMHAAAVQLLAARLGRACVVVAHREDLTRDLDRLLASGPVYFVGTDPRFATKVRAFYAGHVDPAHVRPVILGEEDTADIPAGAPTYVMRTARDRLGGVPPQVRVLATLRAFSRATRLEILRLMVQRNLAAWSAQQAIVRAPAAETTDAH